MNLEQLLAVVYTLSAEEPQTLKTYLTEQQPRTVPHTAEEWVAELNDIAREFRGSSTDEEMREIIEVITTKSKPSEKGL